MGSYSCSGCSRNTPFKQGYIDGLRGGVERHNSFKGRMRTDYERGYCCGLYWATLRRMNEDLQRFARFPVHRLG
jgi:hypothetical protein